MPAAAWFLTLALSFAPQSGQQLPEQEALGHHQFLSSIHILKGATAGEAVCILCSIQVDGELTDEAVAVWGNITVSGVVAGEIVAVGGNVHLLAGSQAGDEIVAVAGHVYQSPEAVVGREIDELPYLYFPGQRSLPWPGAPIFAAATLFLVLLPVAAFSMGRVENLQAALAHRPLICLLLGIGTLVAVGLTGLVTPLLGPAEDWVDTLVFGSVLILAWLGAAGIVQFLGERIFPSRAFGTAQAGAVILVFLLMIPVLGLGVFLTTVAAGLGLAVLTGLGSSPEWLPRRLRRKTSLSPEVTR